MGAGINNLWTAVGRDGAIEEAFGVGIFRRSMLVQSCSQHLHIFITLPAPFSNACSKIITLGGNLKFKLSGYMKRSVNFSIFYYRDAYFFASKCVVFGAWANCLKPVASQKQCYPKNNPISVS